MPGRLDGKIAVITGGPSGIGRATAVRFAEEGAYVVVADLLAGRGAETVQAVERLGRRAIFVLTNIKEEHDCEALAAAAVAEFGRIDVLVAAAGIMYAGYVSGDDPTTAGALGRHVVDKALEHWQEVLAVNLTGTMLTERAVARRMIGAGKGGSIINIASHGAKTVRPGSADYRASKAGVWMLTKVLAVELAPHKIRVNAIGPGLIDTPMSEYIQRDEAVMQNWLENVSPLGRIGRPEDVANTALFLASEEASFYTGEILFPTGGIFTG